MNTAPSTATACQESDMILISLGPMKTWITWGAVAAGVGSAALALPGGVATAATIGNPMAGNLGFGTVVLGDALLGSTETEGTVAVGGDLSVGPSYNVAIHPTATYTAPGDQRATALLVGGRFDTAGSAPAGILRVENDYYVKVGDLSGVKALDTDTNNASVSTRIVPDAGTYDSTARIELITRQPIASIGLGSPPPINFPTLFGTYRQRAQAIAACAANVTLTDAQETPLPAQTGFPKGTTAHVRLTPGVTNVLHLTTADLGNLSELTFTNHPDANTPFVVAVTGTTFLGPTPNLAGVSGQQAPFMLWDFADATSVTITGGDSLEGTIYAPSATLTDLNAANIEGDIVAANFEAGPQDGSGHWVNAGEIHDFPFAAELACEGGGPTSSSSESSSSSPSSPPSSSESSSSEPSSSEASSSEPSPSASPSTTGSDPSESSASWGPTLSTTPEGSGPQHPDRPQHPGRPEHPHEELASTGSATSLLVALVLSLAGVGGALTFLGRRRNGRHVA